MSKQRSFWDSLREKFNYKLAAPTSVSIEDIENGALRLGLADHIRQGFKMTSKYSVQPHGDGFAIYQGRDHLHHGMNLGHLTETTPEIAKRIEDALNAPCFSADHKAKQEQGEPVAWRSRFKDRDGQVITAWVVHPEGFESTDPRVEIEALYTTPQQRKPLTDEQAGFESVFKLPANCTKFEGGYASTSYNAWDAQTFCARWEGWKARAAHGIGKGEA